MNKRIAVLGFAVLLVATLCYAQGAREPFDPTLTNSGMTNMTSLGLNGLNTVGNPGYIMLKGTGMETWGGTTTNGNSNYVLWVDDANDLCIASYSTVSGFASFPSGNWSASGMPICNKVGGQS